MVYVNVAFVQVVVFAKVNPVEAVVPEDPPFIFVFELVFELI
jgi:hypothetical protein